MCKQQKQALVTVNRRGIFWMNPRGGGVGGGLGAASTMYERLDAGFACDGNPRALEMRAAGDN